MKTALVHLILVLNLVASPASAAESENVNFNLSSQKLTSFITTLVFGRETFTALYHLHNAGPDLLEVLCPFHKLP